MRLYCLFISTPVLLCLFARVRTETTTEPSDCVVYPVLHHPRTSVVKTFQGRTKVSFRIPTANRAKTSLRVTILLSTVEEEGTKSNNCSLEFRVASSQKTSSNYINARAGNFVNNDSPDYIKGYCNSWTGSPNGSAVDTRHANLLKFQDWSNLMIAVDNDGSLVITSMDAHDVEIVKFKNSALRGDINLELMSEEERVEVMFDCASNCELRFGGHEYQSTLGNQFFYWRTTSEDSLEVRHRSYSSKLNIVTEEAVKEGVDNWITVVIDAGSKTFNWSIPGTSLWRTTPWSLGNIQSTFEIRNNVDFRVQNTALVTNCHPLQLPCPSNPFNCQKGLEDKPFINTSQIKMFNLSTFKGAIPLIIIILLLIVVFSLSVVVYRLRRARNGLISMEMGANPRKRPASRASSVFPMKIKQDPYGEGNIYDDFMSDDFPADQRVNNTYTSDFFKPKDKAEKQLYYNVNNDL